MHSEVANDNEGSGFANHHERLDGEEDDDLAIVDAGEDHSEETNRFDVLMGEFQDILLEGEIPRLQGSFCREHCQKFGEEDENSHECQGIFKQYADMMERSITSKMTAHGYTMEELLEALGSRKGELGTEVTDVLDSMEDFGAFKELMLSYKEEGSEELRIGGSPVEVHPSEQKEGESRPDLDSSLHVTPFSR